MRTIPEIPILPISINLDLSFKENVETTLENFRDAIYTNALNLAGDYAPAFAYKYNYMVKYSGELYICIKDCTGIAPGNATYWDKVTDKGKSIEWKGAYNNATAYQILDLVFYQNNVYICIQNSTAHNPSDIAYWKLLSQTLSWKGAYNAGTAYNGNDAISYLGSSYLCIQQATGIVPTNTTYWACLAQAGDMQKLVYDSDGDGVVNDSDKLGGQLPAYYAKQSEFDAQSADNAQNVKKYGAIGDGNSHPLSEFFPTLVLAQIKYPFVLSLTEETDRAGIQLAIDTGKSVDIPNGSYRIDIPLITKVVGQIITGQSPQHTYLITAAGSTNDILRVSQSHCKISNIHFRPTSVANRCIRIYAAMATIENCRFLSAAANQGTAVVLDDVNPVDSTVVAGAYLHTIRNNFFGASGYEWQSCIYSVCATNGQQATKIQNNQFMSDRPIVIEKGGGNLIEGNLFQSSTGTYAVPVSFAIEVRAVVNEKIIGNYFERYVASLYIVNLSDTYQVAELIANHYDNVNQPVYSTGSTNYSVYDDKYLEDRKNTWFWTYGSQDNMSLKNKTGDVVFNCNRAAKSLEPTILAHKSMETLSYSANGQTKTPTTSLANIIGNGLHVTGCLIGNGVRDGQHLYLYGNSWSVQLLNTNILYNNSVASVTFGNGTTNIIMMHLIWIAGLSKWVEVSRNTKA